MAASLPVVAAVEGEASGALLPFEPGPTPLLLWAASPVEVAGGVAALEEPLSAKAPCERPNAIAIANVKNNDFDFMVLFSLSSERGNRMVAS